MKQTLLLGTTKAKILNYLLENRRTAGELAMILGTQVSAARKHLEALHELNVVSPQFVQEGLGRPKKFYALTEEGKELFPRQYETILNSILRRLLEARGTGLADRMVKAVASDLVQQLDLGGDRSRKHMELLMAALNRFGFDATLRETKTIYEITSRNCPLHKTAMAHPKLVCEDLHSEMIRQSTNSSNVRLSACVMYGDHACKHVVQKA
ncbi:MAG: helix-turn-helix transcriptional regulator [Nitrososphaerales archaeon]